MNKIIKECITECDSQYKEAQKAIGRYNGWSLICSDLACNIKEVGYDKVKNELEKNDYQIIRWSGLSYDHDDYDDFAIRKGVGSI